LYLPNRDEKNPNDGVRHPVGRIFQRAFAFRDKKMDLKTISRIWVLGGAWARINAAEIKHKKAFVVKMRGPRR